MRVAAGRARESEEERRQLLRYWEEMKADYQRRLIRQSNVIGSLKDELIIMRDIHKKLGRMIEELLETEGQDVDPTIYLRRLNRLMEGSNDDEISSGEG